jgi:hypothetical protein
MPSTCISGRIRRAPLMEQHLVVIQFNCHGLHNKLTEFKIFLYSQKPDVVCLCEAWLKNVQPRFVGYQCFWSHRQICFHRQIYLNSDKWNLLEMPFDSPWIKHENEPKIVNEMFHGKKLFSKNAQNRPLLSCLTVCDITASVYAYLWTWH